MDGAVDDTRDVNFVIHGRNRERLLGSMGAVANKAFDNDPGATMYTGGCTSKGDSLACCVYCLGRPLPAWLWRRLVHPPIASLRRDQRP